MWSKHGKNLFSLLGETSREQWNLFWTFFENALMRLSRPADESNGRKSAKTENGKTGVTPITQSLGSRSLLELEER